MRGRDGKLRVWVVLAVGLVLGSLSAAGSAWAAVWYWSRQENLDWTWVDKTQGGAMSDLERFAGADVPRSSKHFRLWDNLEFPTRGLWAERLGSIDAGASFDQDSFVIDCQGVRAGWPWVTMRGAMGSVAFDQQADPNPQRYRRVCYFALPLPISLVSPLGRSGVPTFLPLRPTAGFAAHAGAIALLFVLAIVPTDVLRRARRRRKGCCPSCGYGLGGARRCPECGRDAAGA